VTGAVERRHDCSSRKPVVCPASDETPASRPLRSSGEGRWTVPLGGAREYFQAGWLFGDPQDPLATPLGTVTIIAFVPGDVPDRERNNDNA
jgi:hypothetical protein